MIKINDLVKEYNLLSGKILALDKINVTFPDTGLYSVIGRSGAGKTTLLNCIAGIDKVDSGSIMFDDLDISSLKGSKLDEYRENIAFIFQDYNLLKEYNVEENIALSISIQGASKKQIQEIVDEKLKKVGLEGYNKRKINELSGGEQQRVVIARALAKKSKIIFCDEPTGNLDEKTAIELFSLLKELSNDLLVIIVTHNNQLASMFSDGIVEIEKGKVINNTIKITENSKKINNELSYTKKRDFPFTFKLCYEHFKHLKVLSLIMILIFICSFTIFTIFTSVSSFNITTAMIATLKNNNQTALTIVNYKDYVEKEETDEGIKYHCGVRVDYKQKTSEEFEKVKNDLQGKASVYKSYYYVKTFSALFGIDYPYDLKYDDSDFIFHYHAFNFNEIIGVDDFSNFMMPLLYGRNPIEENEILIYDYMADSLIYYNIFDCTMEELIGKSIYDKAQNIELKISGIIKSAYKDYAYTDGLSYDSEIFGKFYLVSLKCIFANESLINKMSRNVLSVNGVEIEKSINGEVSREKNNKINKLYFSNNNEFEYIYKTSYLNFGYILTLSQVSSILGIDRKPSSEEIQNFTDLCYGIHDDYISILDGEYFADEVTEIGFYSYSSSPLYGIVDDDQLLDDTSLYIYDSYNNTDYKELNKFYVGLNSDYSNAEEVIEYFEYPSHDNQYYEECIRNGNFYVKEAFCIYDNCDLLISQASDYLYSIKTTAESAVIISVILIIVGISGLCLLSIKKQVYKIGILKSLGMKNGYIQLSYILFIAILAFVACIISIPTSFMVMSEINKSFINTLDGVNLIMFSISNVDIVTTILSTIVISLLSSLVVYIIFTVNPPVMLIRNNKDR